MPLDDITSAFESYAGFLTALSLGANIPNSLSVPQFLANGFMTMLAIGSESGYEFDALKQAMEASKNAAQVQTSAPAQGGGKAEDKKEEAAPEEDESSEGFDLGDMF